MITGDDVLIEYVRRIMSFVRVSSELSEISEAKIQKFLNHKVWNSQNLTSHGEFKLLWQRVESKYLEMQERKRRIFMKNAKSYQTKTEKEFRMLEKEK